MKLILIAICVVTFMSCNSDGKKTDAGTDTSGTTSAMTTTDTAAKSEAWVPVDSATAMNAMMAAGQPGEEQAMLAKSNGNWKAEVTMWESPEAMPMKYNGTVTNKMIMNGRYQLSSFKGNMMGMPFEGSGTTGYDKARKVWTSTWIDNMSTGIMTMDGNWDDATKSITFKGQMLCPANGKMCDIKQVMTTPDDKTQVMEMYGPDMKTGKTYKNMEMKLTKG